MVSSEKKECRSCRYLEEDRERGRYHLGKFFPSYFCITRNVTVTMLDRKSCVDWRGRDERKMTEYIQKTLMEKDKEVE
jgi:hypothetical protein